MGKSKPSFTGGALVRIEKGEAFRYPWVLWKVLAVLIVLSLANAWLFRAQEAPTQPSETPHSAPPPQGESKSEAQPADKKTGPSSLKVEVDLVLVNATVTD